jgi:glycosyltransferase involved in cell wall biosynthesis
MSQLTSLTIFFPCHNEAAHVKQLALDALVAGQRVADTVDVLIINDASTDETAAIADQLADEHAQIRVIHRAECQGYGAALRTGFTNALGEWVFYTDGDGQFSMDHLAKVVDLCTDFDIVSGYRVNRQDPWHRRLYGRCFNALLNRTLGLSLRDVSCAYKLYPKALFHKINMQSDGALIDAEILMKASALGYRIGEVGIPHQPRTAGHATGGNIRVIARAFVELAKLRLGSRQENTRPD